MVWISNPEKKRTFDPESGLELFFLTSSSDGSNRFSIRGAGVEINFTASMTESPLTEEEKADLNIADGAVWFIWRGDEFSGELKSIIYEALMATQWGHGFNPRGNPIFARFGRGALFHV